LIRQSRPSLYFWLEHYLICKIEQITELEQSPSWKNEPVIIKEGICNFNDKATVLYKDYKEWAEDNKIEHILSNPKWKNEIENLDVGIKMFIDNHLNQNKINFNYKDIYEIFKTKYQNKYVESKEENPLNNLEIETY
jgi:phage pi2 protein 07